MVESKKIGIIIINYNTKKITYDCINSILKNCINVPYSIVIWDNNSNDDSFSFFTDKFGENLNIKLFQSKINLGFGKACNQATLLLENYDYYLFLNPDTILESDIILNFISSYEILSEIKQIGCLGVQLYDLSHISKENKKSFPTVFEFIFSRFYFFKKALIPKTFKFKDIEYQPVDYICGADLFIQSNLFLKIGGFDEDYFMYYEEIDLQYKLSQKGYTNILLNNIGLKHIGGASLNENTKLINLYSLESIIKYFKKHSTLLEYFTLKLYLITMFPFLILKSIILKFKSINITYFKNLLRIILKT
jgi:GT2 family glycosyltransferase